MTACQSPRQGVQHCRVAGQNSHSASVALCLALLTTRSRRRGTEQKVMSDTSIDQVLLSQLSCSLRSKLVHT